MRSKWLIALFVFAGVGVVVATILRFLTPQSQPLPESPYVSLNVDGTTSTFKEVSYTGGEVAIPKTAKVASVTSNSTDILEKIVSTYGLTLREGSSTSWLGSEFSLLYIPSINQYSFTSNAHLENAEKLAIRQIAQPVADAFVSSFFTQTKLQLQENEIRYSKDDHGRAGSPNTAQFITFPYSYQIDNYPVKLGLVNLFPLTITINHENQIQKVDFFAQLYTFEEVDIKPTLTVEQAIKNIQLGKASVIRAVNNEFQKVDIQKIESASLTRGSIEYRVDEALRLSYPFYHFFGSAVDSNGTAFEVEILTPAIAVGQQSR